MSIFLTAYDTLAGSGHKHALNQITQALEETVINGQYVVDDNDPNVYRLYSQQLTNIPAFAHPVLVDDESNEKKIFLDLRSFTRLDRASGDYVIKLNNDAVFQINRGILNEIWVNNDPYTLLNASVLPMVVFASIISENLARRFALDPKEQLTISIFAAYYYYCLFSDNDQFDDTDKNRIISSISRNLRVSSSDVLEVLDRIEFTVTDIKVFCNSLEAVTQSVRLRGFAPPVLYQVLGSIWFGVNARELVCIGLEHPPTWIALVHAAYTERTYRNTQLAKTAERKTNRQGQDNFARSIYQLLTRS